MSCADLPRGRVATDFRLDSEHPDSRVEALDSRAVVIAANSHARQCRRSGSWPGPAVTDIKEAELPSKPEVT